MKDIKTGRKNTKAIVNMSVGGPYYGFINRAVENVVALPSNFLA
jgi:hypothetical protein